MALRMARLRRRKSGAWGARITIPKDVRPEYQVIYRKHVDELFYAPPDCPAPRAQVLFSEWQADVKNRIATLRAKNRGEGHDLTQREARALAGEWYRWFVSQYEENPGRPRNWEGALWAFESDVEEAARDPETGEIGELDLEDPEAREYVNEKVHPWFADMAVQFLASRGEALTPAAMTMFLDELIEEFHTAITRLERNATGDYSPDQHLHTLPEYRRKAAPQSAAPRSGKTAMHLFERYISASKLAAETVRRWRATFTTLDEYLAGRDFDALSDDEAQQWVTALVTKKRRASTVMRIWVVPLKALGRWAVKQRHIARNPFADCSVTVPKKTRNRETRAFTTEEIRLILGNASNITDTRRLTKAARRWVPWICAYTGARAGEITQLRGQDVIEPDGIKALRITPEAGTVKTKEARTVPIHEHLIAQGFLDYVKAKGTGPLFYDPAPTDANNTETDITNPKRSRPVRVRSRLAAWTRSIGITDKEVSPTHGWRHTFKQVAARHHIADRFSDAITGHAPPTEGRAYGAPTLEDMAKALKLFPRYKAEPSGNEDDTSRAIDPNQPQPTPAAPTNP
jgi:integrase